MNQLKVPVLIVIALVALGGFIWMLQTYVSPSGAATSKVNITVSQPVPGSQTLIPLGKHVDFLVAPENATDKISGVDLIVDVENGTLDNWDNCKSLDTTGNYSFTELISKSGSKARYSCVIIKDKDQLPPNVTLGGSVSCNGSSTAKVTINKATQVSGPVEGTTYELNKLGDTEVACDGTGGGEARDEDFIASFSPQVCSGDVDSCTYNLKIASNKTDKRISGVYVKLAYDGDILSLNRVKDQDVVLGESTLLAQGTTPAPVLVTATPTPAANIPVTAAPSPTTTGTPSATLTPTAAPTTVTPSASPTSEPSTTPTPSDEPVPDDGCALLATDVQKDGAEYLYTCNMPANKLATSLNHVLTFDTVGQGKGVLSIAAIQVVGPDAVGPYTVHKGKATYNIGSSSGKGNIQLDMKLRLQCVPKKPKGAQELEVKVGLGDGGLKKPMYETATFKVDGDGFWRGSVSFNAPAGRGYKILPKGDKHMQKKVCVNNPTEDFPGAYGCDKGQIVLRDGKNEIDFTKIVLLTGDLPPGEQDGISNAKDQSLVRNLVGKRDEESAALADINFDGVVNAVDHSCMIAALSVRWDEE